MQIFRYLLGFSTSRISLLVCTDAPGDDGWTRHAGGSGSIVREDR